MVVTWRLAMSMRWARPLGSTTSSLVPVGSRARWRNFLHHVLRGRPVPDEQHREAEQAQPVFCEDVPDIPGDPRGWRVGHTRLVPFHA
jgi:hypothetical protein